MSKPELDSTARLWCRRERVAMLAPAGRLDCNPTQRTPTLPPPPSSRCASVSASSRDQLGHRHGWSEWITLAAWHRPLRQARVRRHARLPSLARHHVQGGPSDAGSATRAWAGGVAPQQLLQPQFSDPAGPERQCLPGLHPRLVAAAPGPDGAGRRQPRKQPAWRRCGGRRCTVAPSCWLCTLQGALDENRV